MVDLITILHPKRMKIYKYFILISILTTTTFKLWATPLPQTKNEFCARYVSNTNDTKINVLDLSSETTNLMSFKNDGGLFNGGVCWWHARFQRNIFYLSIFKPNLPKPQINEIKKIIQQVRLGNSVVTIPGYANLSDFSSENQKLIQAELNDWQLYDGVVLGSWIDGLKGETKVPASELQAKMDEVFQYVNVKKKIAYEKLQIKGITSHAWLIVNVKKMSSGYDLNIIDSNNPRMCELYSYKNGDESFHVSGYGDFVPYLEFKREEERLTQNGKTYCGIKSAGDFFTNAKMDYERDLQDMKRE